VRGAWVSAASMSKRRNKKKHVPNGVAEEAETPEEATLEAKWRQEKQDDIADAEISCFVLPMYKENEKESSKLVRWLVETRWKKSWILMIDHRLSPSLFWNDTDSLKKRPENVWMVQSLSNEEREFAEGISIRKDVVDAFSKLFVRQTKGHIGKIHNVIIVPEGTTNMTPLVRAFFLDGFPSLKRVLLHGIMPILVPHKDISTNRPTLLVKDKNFSQNIAISDSVFVISASVDKCEVDEDTVTVLNEELFQLNDRFFIKHIGAKSLENKIASENKTLRARTDFELYSYSRWALTAATTPSTLYLDHLESTKNLEQPQPPPHAYKTLRFKVNGNFAMEKVQYFLDTLMKENPGIIRIKGYFAMKGAYEKFILQGCNGFWGMEAGETFSNERRCCRLLVVGRNLPHQEVIEKNLKDCFATMSMFERWIFFYESERILACLGMLTAVSFWAFVVLLSMELGFLNTASLRDIWQLDKPKRFY
jgi:G3E family GTPase